MCYNKARNKGSGNPKNRRKDKKMKTRGWYTFADGYRAWFSGLSGTEKKWEIVRHGKIVKFEHTA